VTTAPNPGLKESLPAPVAAALGVPADKRSPQQVQTIAAHVQSLDVELQRLRQAAAEAPAPFDVRLVGAQDLAWALINSPAFLFNH
jgi:hypothetical protein